MKLYKLKEEVKKYYVAADPDARNSMDYWEKQHLLPEALEEVPQRIELNIVTLSFMEDEPRHMYLKRSTGQWTEQERKDIETFLNDFGSMDVLHKLIYDYSQFKGHSMSFKSWLKENK